MSVDKKLVFVLGRFQPPTFGHWHLIKCALSVDPHSDFSIFISPLTNTKKNPLSLQDRIDILESLFPETTVNPIPKRGLINLMKQINKSYNKVTLVCGADRSKEYKKKLREYNKKEYNFKEIKIIPIERYGSVSGTRARSLAVQEEYEEFKKTLPGFLSTEEAFVIFKVIQSAS